MTSEEKIIDLIQFIVDQHAKCADGCKSSCGIQSVGMRHEGFGDQIGKLEWYASFGGYCFGDMSRGETVTAPNLDALCARVRLAIKKAIAEDELEAVENND